MTEKRLLACFAHPDDESFGCGGTLAHYAAQGVKVILLCTTRGEAGEISNPSLATPDTLAEIRTQELKCAAEALGISEIILLDYRDSGMPGSAENSHPDAFINADQEQVISQIVQAIRLHKPHIVITFEPDGGYGHPDHIAVSRHTTAAFKAAGDGRLYPEAGQAWQAGRLFYTSIPRSFFLDLQSRLESLGMDTADFARYKEQGIGWKDENIHIELDISHSIEAKWKAFHCHRTQLGAGNLFMRLPEAEMKERMSRECFAFAGDVPAGIIPSDLFAGLDIL